MSKKNDESLQAQLAQLDQVVAWFDQEDFDVEQALGKYEQGIELVAAIEERLKTLENKVEVLKKRFDQAG